jgi:hypothetical protein
MGWHFSRTLHFGGVLSSQFVWDFPGFVPQYLNCLSQVSFTTFGAEIRKFLYSLLFVPIL